ncbi:uncharacterized protein C8A04DRAFT_9721 [Dichotomopilus funicola]|uniref:Required for respiratory growth protein 9, mitochondrial n=1 Tax=Dichotomopilus funicola TaxID=1934379 RepID=A0AAN6V7S1_9PEZI|nr:hypothetical protein C8A04DRAFT_9721 [Dichotomopilus funicola]
MDCSCRTAALRIFVRNITRVQVSLPLRTIPHGRGGQYRALSTQQYCLGTQKPSPLATATSRALHTSCARKSSAVGAALVVDDGGYTNNNNNYYDDEDTPEFTAADAADYHIETPAPGPRVAAEPSPRPSEGSRSSRTQSKSSGASSDWAKPNAKKFTPKESWKIQKEALKEKFPDGWNPRKKISPDALAGIRMLNKQFPETYTTAALAQKFEVSPEAIRRILKSKWTPDAEAEERRETRWHERGKQVWSKWAALGKKPPRKWREEGIVRDPVWNEPRGPTHKNKHVRADMQRRLARAMRPY